MELCETAGLQFVQDLRTANFMQGFEQEVKMLTNKCKIITSKRIDFHKDKVAREFELTSSRLRQLSS